MPVLSPGPLADALDAQRDVLNRAYRRAAAQHRALEPEALGAFLRDVVTPIVEAVAAEQPHAVEPAVVALFEAACELLGRGLVGSDTAISLLELVWSDVLLAGAGHVAADPKRVIGSLSNAALQIARAGGVDATRWISCLIDAAALAEGPTPWLDAGLVLAWTSGLAHYRETALSIWKALPDDLARLTVGEDERLQRDTIERRLESIWGTHGLRSTRLAIAARVGGFTGFGGPFVRPPKVGRLDGRIAAFTDDGVWTVHADRFGATLRPLRTEERPDETPDSSVRVDDDGTIRWGELSGRFDLLTYAASVSATEDLIAITLPRSHWVYLVAEVATDHPAVAVAQ